MEPQATTRGREGARLHVMSDVEREKHLSVKSVTDPVYGLNIPPQLTTRPFVVTVVSCHLTASGRSGIFSAQERVDRCPTLTNSTELVSRLRA